MTSIHRSAAWITFTKKARPIIARQLPQPCVNYNGRCSGIVLPSEQFDVAHLPGYDHLLTQRMPTLAEVGPAHPSCNRSAGAKLAATRRAKAKARAQRMPNW